MDQQLAAELLAGDSDEISELRSNITALEGFIDLIQKLDAKPNISKRFWEESRSLYQGTSKDCDMATLETQLSDFFGPPAKAADKPLPRKLNKESAVRHLGGIQKEQSLFLMHLKSGTFYGALWPWRHNKTKIEIHLGYCSDWMVDEDYRKLETLVKRSVSQSAFAQMDAHIGGQIRGIGLPSFLQMAEMEQSTFTLRVTAGGRLGELHVENGKLLAAQTEHWTGRDAAYRIISWDDTTVEISPIAENVSDEIQQPLMHVLMESLKIKDEITSSTEAPTLPPPRRSMPSKGPIAKPAKKLVRLERTPLPPKPRRRRMGFLATFAIVLAGIVLLGTGGLIGLRMIQKNNQVSAYNELMDRLSNAGTPLQKLTFLKKFLQNHADSAQLDKVKQMTEATQKEIERNDYEEITLKLSSMPMNEDYEKKAFELYSAFLDKYPDSEYTGKINESIKVIKGLLDQYYFNELKQAARLDWKSRLKIYDDYLKRFPTGAYHKDVAFLIQELGNSYLDSLNAEAQECKANQQWDNCIQHYDAFIASFNKTDLAMKAEQQKRQLMDDRDLVQVNKAVADAGNDYQKAAELYQAFLDNHPQTAQKRTIEQELARLKKNITLQRQWMTVRKYASNPDNGIFERIQYVDSYIRDNPTSPFTDEAQSLLARLDSQHQTLQQQEQRRIRAQEEQAQIQKEKELAAQRRIRMAAITKQLDQQLAESPRYQANDDGTVMDRETGATWTLLDSYQELGGCITYENALAYVKTLNHGGYRDWRLPTANELASLYKKAPYFPASGALWYWSSNAYVKGFHTVVDIVTAKPETIFEREYRTQDECGAVRAIRP